MINIISNQKIAVFIILIFTLSLLETSPKIETDSSSKTSPVKQKETFFTIDSIGTNTPAAIPTQEETSQYNISVVFDPSARTATGWMNVSFLNTEVVSFDELYFHIWPKYYSSDSIIIHSILNRTDMPLSFEVENTVNLRVDLPIVIQSQERCIIRIQFTTKLLLTSGRFSACYVTQDSLGYLYSFTNWHPVLSVYEDGAWNKNPFFDIGEAFYADMAYYRINISAPSAQLLAGAGDLKNVVINGGINEYFWIAGPVREFSWFSNDKWEVVSKMHNDVNISVFHYPSHEEGAIQALNVTSNCIDLFSELFEPCPYKSFVIIECPSIGMEYCQAVMISDAYFPDPTKKIAVGSTYFNLERLVTHEISHAWNAFIIGNNPYNDPWLDEGWATYTTEYLYAEEFHSQEIADQELLKSKNFLINAFLDEVFLDWDDTPIIMSADYYSANPSQYGYIAYGKASQIIHLLRFVMGDVKFFSSLEAYYDAFSYKTVTTEDFKQVFEQTSNTNLDWFFDQYVYNKGFPEYNITLTTYSEITGCETGWQMEIKIKQEQPDVMINYIPITLEFENTSSSQILQENYMVWVNQSTETIHFDVPADYRPIRMQLDPDWGLFRENATIESLFTKSSDVITRTCPPTTISTPTSSWNVLLLFLSLFAMLSWRQRKKKS